MRRSIISKLGARGVALLFAALGIGLFVSTTQAFVVLKNKNGRQISWRKFPQDVLVYGDTSKGLDATGSQQLIEKAFNDWADEGCFMTSANVMSQSGTDWASGNGKNEVVWITGDAANYNPYKPTLGNLGVDQPCDADAKCGSGICIGTCKQPGQKKVGDACTGDEECSTYACVSSECVERSVVLGLAILVYPQEGEPFSILEADIILNETTGGLDYASDSNTTPTYSVVAHEVGHFLGLSHESSLPVDSVLMHPTPQTTMIQNDDRDGLCVQYPPGQALCDSDCDCFRGNRCEGYPDNFPSDDMVPRGSSCPRAELCLDGMCEEVLAAARGELCALGAANACDGAGTCEGASDSTEKCEGGVTSKQARGTCGGPCTGDAECPPNGRCLEQMCDYPKSGQPGDPCMENFDCENQICSNNVCGEPCAEDCNCGVLGERCHPELNVCVKGRSSCYRTAQGDDVLDRRLTANACRLGLSRAPAKTLWPFLTLLVGIAVARTRRRKSA